MGDLGRPSPAHCLLAELKLTLAADIGNFFFLLVSQGNEPRAIAASAYVQRLFPARTPVGVQPDSTEVLKAPK